MKPQWNNSVTPAVSPPTDYHGLQNQGSTCYLNCVLQVLFMTKDFREAVESYEHCSETPSTVETMDHQLQDLFNELKTRIARTREITSTLGIENVFEQRDAAEYLEKILRSLASQEASKIFCAQLRHRNTCCRCWTHTDEDGPCWSLPLALTDDYSKDYSVVDGVEAFFSTSTVSGDEQMYCDLCDAKTNATIKCDMKSHPEVLTLLLKRFEFNYFYMDYVKINSPVNVPRTLQIPESHTYELYAVVDHFGNLKGGHYTATIKSQDDNRWYEFDDTWVTEVTPQPYQEDITKSYSAYLLMYRKKKMHAPDVSVQEPSPQRQQVDTIYYDEQCHDALNKRRREDSGEAAEKHNDTLNSVSPERSENGTEETEDREVLNCKNKVEKQNTNYDHEQCDDPPEHRQRKEGDKAEGNDPAEAAPTKRHECVIEDTENREAVSVKNRAVSTPIYTYFLQLCPNQSSDSTDQGSGRLSGVRQKKPFEAQERKGEVVEQCGYLAQVREKEKGDEATGKDNNSVEAVSVERSECGTEETGNGEGVSVRFIVENDAQRQGKNLIQFYHNSDIASQDSGQVGDVTQSIPDEGQEDKKEIFDTCTTDYVSVEKQGEEKQKITYVKGEKQPETGYDKHEQLDCITKREGSMTKKQVGKDAQHVKGEYEPTASTQKDLAKGVQNLKLSASAAAKRKKRRTKRNRRNLEETKDGTDSRVQKRINETDAPLHRSIKHERKYRGARRERQSRLVPLWVQEARSVRRKGTRTVGQMVVLVDFPKKYAQLSSKSE